MALRALTHVLPLCSANFEIPAQCDFIMKGIMLGINIQNEDV